MTILAVSVTLFISSFSPLGSTAHGGFLLPATLEGQIPPPAFPNLEWDGQFLNYANTTTNYPLVKVSLADEEEDEGPPMVEQALLPPPPSSLNWTTTTGHVVSSRRRRATTADDFYDALPPPTIAPEVCVNSVEEFQSLNTALQDALTKMISSAPSSAECANYRPSQQRTDQKTSTDCGRLTTYIKATANSIVCENVKKMDIVSNGNYLALEAKYEEKVQNIKKVIEKLKQSNAQYVNQLKDVYNQRLQLLQLQISQLLQEIKELKQTVQEKQVVIVVEKITALKFSEAADEYREMKVFRDISIPTILRRVYQSGNPERMGQIDQFIGKLSFLEEQLVACDALYDIMKQNNDLESMSILVLYSRLHFLVGLSNFNQMLESMSTLGMNLKSRIELKLSGVLSSLGGNIRDGNYPQIVAFACGQHTWKYFYPHGESIMRGSYTGILSLGQILPFLRTMPCTNPTIACAKGLLKRMKETGDLTTRGGLELIFTLSKWSNVISDSGLVEEIPASLNIFGWKKCVLRNLDKGREFLSATDEIRHSGERRRVVTHPSNWHVGENTKWILNSDDWGKTFEILNVKYNEYLYAAGDYYKYDSDRRSVFTWVPGGSVRQGVWEIEPDYQGRFRIKNTAHGERLYAAVDDFRYYKNWRRVFTWGNKWENHNDEYWNITCE